MSCDGFDIETDSLESGKICVRQKRQRWCGGADEYWV